MGHLLWSFFMPNLKLAPIQCLLFYRLTFYQFLENESFMVEIFQNSEDSENSDKQICQHLMDSDSINLIRGNINSLILVFKANKRISKYKILCRTYHARFSKYSITL